jgi:pimeloyl-ACP methyl ester carboxylesterase
MSAETSDQAKATIVLIHGLWMTPRSWEHWVDRYKSRGHEVLAPSWPGMEGEVEQLNRDPSPMKGMGITKIVDHYDNIIRGLGSPPIVMGHSIGGTVLQLLVDRGLGRAAVGIAPGTVKGVPDLPLSTLRSSFPVLGNPFNRGKATGLSAKQFHYAFCNTMSREESDRVYERYHVPAANRALFDVGFATFTRNGPTTVDFTRDDRAPLLSIAFSQDHIVPPKAARHNVEKYGKSKAITVFKEFPGRPHFPGAPGWEEVADYALEWATNPTAGEAKQAEQGVAQAG